MASKNVIVVKKARKLPSGKKKRTSVSTIAVKVSASINAPPKPKSAPPAMPDYMVDKLKQWEAKKIERADYLRKLGYREYKEDSVYKMYQNHIDNMREDWKQHIRGNIGR